MTIDSGTHITAHTGSVKLHAGAEVVNFPWAQPTIEDSGTVALAFAVGVDNADVKTQVDGTIDAADGIENTFSAVDGRNVDYDANTIHIHDHGFTDGEAVVYSHGETTGGLGAVSPPDIGGLKDGKTYYVHVVDDNDIQLTKAPALQLGYTYTGPALPVGTPLEQSFGTIDQLTFDSAGVTPILDPSAPMTRSTARSSSRRRTASSTARR